MQSRPRRRRFNCLNNLSWLMHAAELSNSLPLALPRPLGLSIYPPFLPRRLTNSNERVQLLSPNRKHLMLRPLSLFLSRSPSA